MFLKKEKNFFLVGLIALLIGAIPFPALAQKSIAQSDAFKSAVEDVNDSVSALESSSEEEVMDIEKEKKQTKDALQKIFQLTQTEIQELIAKDRLAESIDDSDADIAKLGVHYTDTLSGYFNYINLLLLQLDNEGLSLESIKLSAGDFKNWRAEIYEPKTKEVFDFLVFLQAKSILETANDRFTLIEKEVKQIENRMNKVDSKAMNSYLEGAKKNLKTAEVHQNKAKSELLKLQSKNLSAELEKISLRQGYGGSFTCLSSNTFLPSACTPVFRMSNGQYLLLIPGKELNKNDDLEEIFQASGVLLASAPIKTDYAFIGTVRVSAINLPNEEVIMPYTKEESEETKKTENSIPKKSDDFRQAVKAEFTAVSSTYSKYFFAMSKIAKKY
jgi:hypothetical protein